jgi:hypothetical protein
MLLRRSRGEEPAETTPAAQSLSDQLGLLERIAAQGGEVVFGAPTRCPACGAVGFVDGIARGVQDNGCLRCGKAWRFSAKAVALFEDAHRGHDQPEVVGRGVLVADLDRDRWAHVTRERFVGFGDALDPPGRA